jgi:hypothetical protein
MTMMLRRAILVSILVHLAVLSSFRQPVLLPDMTTRAASRAINALLHSAEFPKPESQRKRPRFYHLFRGRPQQKTLP